MPASLANPAIKHVFVLMMENRSFDHMLGYLDYQGVDARTGQPRRIDGIQPAMANIYKNVSFKVANDAADIMNADPGHELQDVVEQLCGPGVTYTGGSYPPINNSGFVSNFAHLVDKDPRTINPQVRDVMRCYDSARQLRVLSTLAQEFGVCDRWFSALPGPTWPNRLFVHAASSTGLDHSPGAAEIADREIVSGYSFQNGTIYDLFDKHFPENKAWRLYRGRQSPLIGAVPCVGALKGVSMLDTHPYEHLEADLHGDYPFAYTFIEPNYGDYILHQFTGGQSQHPNDNVQNGEELIRSTYEAIRNSPLWTSSLLIITYDEHGGFFDHVAPLGAIAPGDTAPNGKHNKFGFTFEQYGTRVPAVVISAYTAKGSISSDPYDHTSVPATLEAIFGLPSMTKRDAQANNVTILASLPEARMDTPANLNDIPRMEAMAPKDLPPMELRRSIEAVTPVDGGNLPGFLHVVQKADMEKRMRSRNIRSLEAAPEQTGFLLEPFTRPIANRLEARNYLESTLPGLFEIR